MALPTAGGQPACGGPRGAGSASRRNQLPVPPDQYAAGPRRGVTDATPDLDDAAIAALQTAMDSGALPQHVQLLGVPPDWAAPAGPHPPAAGPFKIIIDDTARPSGPLHYKGPGLLPWSGLGPVTCWAER